jgi:flagellar basal body-associated protein FliL
MAQQHNKFWIILVSAVVVLVLAIVIVPRLMSNGVAGTVTAVDTTGMATVKTEDGQEHKMQGPGWQVGDKVECDTQGGQVTCEKS